MSDIFSAVSDMHSIGRRALLRNQELLLENHKLKRKIARLEKRLSGQPDTGKGEV